MEFNLQIVKSHWKIILGGVVGLVILYYLVEKLSGSSAASSSAASSPSGTSDAQLTAINSAADLTNANANAAITTAQINGQVQDNATAANLQATLAQTAAQLAIGQQQISAGQAVAIDQDQTQVSLQDLQSSQAVQQTQIEGQTLTQLEGINAGSQVDIANINAQAELSSQAALIKQISDLGANSKNAAKDYQAITPIIALETGQGGAAATVGAANASASAATSIAKTTAISSGIQTLLTGLFQ